MKKTASISQKVSTIATLLPILNIFIIKDEGRYMAKCTEIDLVTEMNTEEEAKRALLEMIKEYAEDYQKNLNKYLKSPNRSHHKPYVDRILACTNDWELMELIEIRYGHV